MLKIKTITLVEGSYALSCYLGNSQTKQIYNATKESERLMVYLENSLLTNNLVELIGEQPVPEKGREYGVMIYYYKSNPKVKLLSAAPRRKGKHIHVVLFRGILNRDQLLEKNLTLGNSKDPQPDLKINTIEEIDILIKIVQANIQI